MTAPELVRHHSIRIARPFDVVERQLARLDDRWVEDAVRGALRRGHVSEADDVRTRFGDRCSGPEGFVLPVAWEIDEPVGPHIETGRLDVVAVPAGPDETQVGVRIAAGPAAGHPGAEEQRRIGHALEITSECLLSRVFWTLEVLCQSDPKSGDADRRHAGMPRRSPN